MFVYQNILEQPSIQQSLQKQSLVFFIHVYKMQKQNGVFFKKNLLACFS